MKNCVLCNRPIYDERRWWRRLLDPRLVHTPDVNPVEAQRCWELAGEWVGEPTEDN